MPLTLQEQLDNLRHQIAGQYTPEMLELLTRGNHEILTLYLEDKALKAGEKAPDATFFDQNLKKVFTEDILKDKHLIISFFRGTWCPYCNLELIALNQVYDQIKARGGELISVSPELLKYSQESIKTNQFQYKILYDANNSGATKFGLVFELPLSLREIYMQYSLDLKKRNGDDSWILPMPATFIISKDGIIRKTFVNADYTKRMEPAEILTVLDQLPS